jgi:hypothetical protein
LVGSSVLLLLAILLGLKANVAMRAANPQRTTAERERLDIRLGGFVVVIVPFIGKAVEQAIEVMLLAQTVAIAARLQALDGAALIRGRPQEAAGSGHAGEVL